MNKKALAILMRARMRPNNSGTTKRASLSPITEELTNSNKMTTADSHGSQSSKSDVQHITNNERGFDSVRVSMHSAISMNKTEVLDAVLDDFAAGYLSLSQDNRRNLLLVLAKEYDLNRMQVHGLMKQYLGLDLPFARGEEMLSGGVEEEGMLSTYYRLERNLRHALQPTYEVLFERLNTHPGGLKVLTILRADILKIVAEENNASLRALDVYLKEKLSTWLSPAALELHQITWDDPASLLEKIVTYEAVHPISNLLDLKRRLGVGRRCFGYLHPAIPGEPLIFIEVALLTNVAQTIQEVLWVDPPIPEYQATCALFYSISSTQPGLAGINLGKFLIKRVITLVKRDMPYISTFATLSPIPGYMQWLLSKLGSQIKIAEAQGTSNSLPDKSGFIFQENILEPQEEIALMESSGDLGVGKNGMEVLLNLLMSTNHEWSNSEKLLAVLKPILMRLCARYLLQEKKRGKALDSVANFHLQNGAMVERINWMADRSDKGLRQSGGIMVNYIYRLEAIEEYALSYLSTGHIHASQDILSHVHPLKAHETTSELKE